MSVRKTIILVLLGLYQGVESDTEVFSGELAKVDGSKKEAVDVSNVTLGEEISFKNEGMELEANGTKTADDEGRSILPEDTYESAGKEKRESNDDKEPLTGADDLDGSKDDTEEKTRIEKEKGGFSTPPPPVSPLTNFQNGPPTDADQHTTNLINKQPSLSTTTTHKTEIVNKLNVNNSNGKVASGNERSNTNIKTLPPTSVVPKHPDSQNKNTVTEATTNGNRLRTSTINALISQATPIHSSSSPLPKPGSTKKVKSSEPRNREGKRKLEAGVAENNVTADLDNKNKTVDVNDNKNYVNSSSSNFIAVNVTGNSTQETERTCKLSWMTNVKSFLKRKSKVLTAALGVVGAVSWGVYIVYSIM